MTDQWVPGPPPVATPPIAPLPGANSWNSVEGCSVGPNQPSITNGIIITGVPATIVAPNAWRITLNDGGGPANFTIDHYDASGVLIEHPIAIDGATGDVTLNHDPTQPLGAATKEYVDNTGVREAPEDGLQYGRQSAGWTPIPQIIPEAPTNSFYYARFNSVWAPVPIQSDAPSDGNLYARWDNGWQVLPDFTTYMPKSGGIFTGPVTFPSNNSVVIDGGVNTPHAILGRTAGLMRWQLQMPDPTTEGLNNTGANFTLTAFSTTGAALGTWLSIARADGAASFNGASMYVAGNLSVNGVFLVSNVGNFYLPGGTAEQVLSTNGSGLLSWATRLADAPSDGQFYTRQNAAWAVAPGGMTDAPNDGTAYARKSQGWAHLTHTDITDWTATLAPYALTTAVPVASTTPPLMDGTAAVGTSAAFARGDHVHPTDTSRAAVSALPPASTVVPLIDGVGAVGVSMAYARADHVHPLPPQAMGDNRIINGNFAVNQRGQVSGTALAAAAYGHDRWKAGAAGCTYTFTAALPDTTITITAGSLTQIIEAGMIEGSVYTLSWTGTAQARVYQGAPSGAYAASPIVTASLPAGVNTIVEFNTGTIVRVKLEIGTGATPYNRQSLAKSQADCERYFRWVPVNIQFNASGAGYTISQTVTFSSAMRAAPTIVGPNTDPNIGSPQSTNVSSCTYANMVPYGAMLYLVSTSTGTTMLQGYRVSASAEL